MMTKISNKARMKFVTFVGVLLLLVGITFIILPKIINANIHTETITVVDKQFINKVSSTNDEVNTEQYWLITSKDKAYKVNIEGVFAQPQIPGQLKINHTYEVKSLLKSGNPSLGIYPIIVEIICEK